MKASIGLAALALALALALGTAAAAQDLSILDRVDGRALPWGVGSTIDYGQTITFSEDITLDGLEVLIDDEGRAMSYNMMVQEWVGRAPRADILFYTSAVTTGVDGFQPAVFDLDGLELPAGTYVLRFTATSEGEAAFARVEDGIADGAWVHEAEVWETTEEGVESYVGMDWFISESTDLAFRLTVAEDAPAVEVAAND